MAKFKGTYINEKGQRVTFQRKLKIRFHGLWYSYVEYFDWKTDDHFAIEEEDFEREFKKWFPWHKEQKEAVETAPYP